MAKASSRLPSEPIASNPPFTFLNIDEASAALLRLMNESPRTPTYEQIHTVLVQAAQDEKADPVASKIRALIEPLKEAIVAVSETTPGDDAFDCADARWGELNAECSHLCKQLWASPVVSFDDLLVRAEIAQFAAKDWPDHPYGWPMLSEASSEESHMDIREARQLVIAVLALGGRPYAVKAPRDAPLQSSDGQPQD